MRMCSQPDKKQRGPYQRLVDKRGLKGPGVDPHLLLIWRLKALEALVCCES